MGLGRQDTTRSGATREELEQRERDLRAREEALAANEARMSGVQVNNWPPCTLGSRSQDGSMFKLERRANDSLPILSS